MIELVNRGLAGERALIMIPGAGVGAFSIAAARRWPHSTTVAVDVNPVTLGLLATRIAFEIDGDPSERRSTSESICASATISTCSARSTPSARSRTQPGNPPYTRVQQLPLGERRRAIDLAGIIDNGHANLATLIQAMTLWRMRTRGRLLHAPARLFSALTRELASACAERCGGQADQSPLSNGPPPSDYSPAIQCKRRSFLDACRLGKPRSSPACQRRTRGDRGAATAELESSPGGARTTELVCRRIRGSGSRFGPSHEPRESPQRNHAGRITCSFLTMRPPPAFPTQCVSRGFSRCEGLTETALIVKPIAA